MAIDPALIPASRRGMVLSDPVECRSCGYNLQGLEAGRPCPECGETIPLKRFGGKGDNLTDAPPAYLRRYAMVSAAAGWLGVCAALVSIGAYVLTSAMIAGVAAIAALAFLVSVVPLTSPRPRSENTVNDATLDDPRWRLAARLGPGGWLALAVCVLLHAMAVEFGWRIVPVTAVLHGLAVVVAFAGMTPLLIHLGSMADWAGDEALASRLRGSAWVLAVGTAAVLIISLVESIVSGPLNGLINILRLAVLVVYTLGLAVGLLGMVQLGVDAFAAVRTSAEQHARDQRIAHRRAQEMAVTVERQFSAPAPVDVIERSAPPGEDESPRPRIGQGQRIERTGDAEAYELAPEEPAPADDHRRRGSGE
ncbi:MAG: hypothetical protein ACTS22_05940 [Phycisphaerales bacterium]